MNASVLPMNVVHFVLHEQFCTVHVPIGWVLWEAFIWLLNIQYYEHELKCLDMDYQSNIQKHGIPEDVAGSLKYDPFSGRISVVLTGRELEVLCLVGEGMTSDEIGCALHLSTATIQSHRKNMLTKTGARNGANLIWLACKQGWI